MHSDFWADVPYEHLPEEQKNNVRVIRRMDRFWEVARANRATLVAYVEALLQGEHSECPLLDEPPIIHDPDMEFMMEGDIKEARTIVELSKGTEESMIRFFASEWSKELKGEGDYLVYNKNALERRKNPDGKWANYPEEIHRVQGLIDEGEVKIRWLEQRIAWAIIALHES